MGVESFQHYVLKQRKHRKQRKQKRKIKKRKKKKAKKAFFMSGEKHFVE